MDEDKPVSPRPLHDVFPDPEVPQADSIDATQETLRDHKERKDTTTAESRTKTPSPTQKATRAESSRKATKIDTAEKVDASQKIEEPDKLTNKNPDEKASRSRDETK